MGLLNDLPLETPTEEVDKAEEPQTPVVPEVPEEPETPEEPVEETQKPTSDRSAYNCPDCKGEGLVDSNTRCVTCLGTGKLNPQNAQYPEGTVVIKPDGQYRMTNGQLVKE